MNSEIDALRQIERELVEAFLRQDVKALDRILADEFIITDPDRPFCTKGQFLAELETKRVSFKSLVIDEMNVRVVDGSSAFVTGRATADGYSPNGPYRGRHSFMDVYVRKDSGWRTILSIVDRD